MNKSYSMHYLVMTCFYDKLTQATRQEHRKVVYPGNECCYLLLLSRMAIGP